MSALSKIVNATPTGGGNNIRDGRYKYLVEKCIYNPKGFNGEIFIAELRVIESVYNGDVDEAGKPTMPNSVGSTVSMTCLLDKFENAAGNAKAFLLGAMTPLGYVEAQITEQLILDVSGPANPLRGVVVGNETRRGYNKGRRVAANAGKPLTLNNWKPIAQTVEDIKAQRAWLDSNLARADVQPAGTLATGAAAAQTAATEIVTAPVTSTAVVVPPPATSSSGVLAALGLTK